MILMNSKSQQPIFFCQSQEEEIVPFIQANDPIEFSIKRSKQKLLIKPVIHIVNRL